MASVTLASEIIDDIEATLQDESNDFWSEAEHLKAINDGMKEISTFKPDVYIASGAVTLAAGVEQTLPDGGFQLQEITCNMGTTPGTTPGKVIRLVERKKWDAMNPNWRSATASAVVDCYIYNERIPLQFLVSPPQPSSGFGFVEMSYCKTPTEIAIDAVILVPDIYRTALFYYGLSRAYLKESGGVTSANKVTTYYNAFLNAIGERQNTEIKEDPNAN